MKLIGLKEIYLPNLASLASSTPIPLHPANADSCYKRLSLVLLIPTSSSVPIPVCRTGRRAIHEKFPSFPLLEAPEL